MRNPFADLFRRSARPAPPAVVPSAATDDPEWVKAAQITAHDVLPGVRSGFITSARLPRRGTREILAAYQCMPFLRATVAKIAGNAAQVPGRLYVRRKRKARPGETHKPGESKFVEDAVTRSLSHAFKLKELKALRNVDELEVIGGEHPLLRLLREPMPDDTRFKGRTLLFLTYAWLDLVGEAFWFYSTNAAGMPTAIYPIPPDWVREIPTKSRPFYTVMIDGAEFQIPITNCLWFKDPVLANPYGRGAGVGHAVADELDVDENASKHLSSFFYNRAMPDMLVSVENADEEMLLATKARFEQDHRGILNAYRSAFVNGKVNVARLDTSFKDMDLVALRKFSGREIVVQAFGLSPEMLGVLDNSNRATVFEARAMFAENVLLPRIDLVESVLQDFALLFDERLIFAFDDPKPDDVKFILEVAKARPHVFTENEWRVLAGQEPVEGGDVFRYEDGKVVADLSHGVESDEVAIVGTEAGSVQDQALNGAQISSLLIVIQAVAAGTLPKETARILLREAFPSIDQASIDAMLDPIEEGSIPELGELAPEPAPPPAAGAKEWRAWSVRALLSGLKGVFVHRDDVRTRLRLQSEITEAVRERSEVAHAVEALADDPAAAVKVEAAKARLAQLDARIAKLRAELRTISTRVDKFAITRRTKSPTEDEVVDAAWEALRAERLTTEALPLVEDTLKEIGEVEAASVGAAGTFNMLNPLIAEYLESFGATRIAGLVDETTKEALRKTLIEGVRAGENVARLSARVRDVFDAADKARAEIIARTEVVGASNRAIYGAHVMSGVVQKRQWTGTPDGRSRDEHKAGVGILAGQVRGIGEPFRNRAGAAALHPGGFGIKSEDIGCRCTTVPVIGDPKSANDLEIMQRDFEARIAPYEERMVRALRRGFKAQREDVLDALSKLGDA